MLLWAADPTLSRVHPPWRRVAYYSHSIRYVSTLANGTHDAHSARESVRRADVSLARDRMILSTSSQAPSSETHTSSASDSEHARSQEEVRPDKKTTLSAGTSSNTSVEDDSLGKGEAPEGEKKITRSISGQTLVGSTEDGSPGKAKAHGPVREGIRNISGQTLVEGTDGSSPKEPDRKLLPHDVSRLPEEYKTTWRMDGINWARIPWVPTLHNPTDPGEPHPNIQ